MQHEIEYPDGSREIIKHYGMFAHSSGGFAFYIEEELENSKSSQSPYIFISGANVRKISPLGAV